MIKKSSLAYRKDIDGLRAIAVLAVILFHFGLLPNGYLGVDIFFVISGYLITRIIFTEVIENKFSLTQFYQKRLRRIIPLVLFTTSFALILGIFVMLPDDLENLSQSVIATNLFGNNILLLLTTGNYWRLVNEYKPLMHTWSLGIEEQFYFFYPLIFIVLKNRNKKFLLFVLSLLTFLSLSLFILSDNESSKFYLIQFRYFEISLGGLIAILFYNKTVNNSFNLFCIIFILFILFFNVQIPNNLKLLSIVLASLGILIPNNNYLKKGSFILENKVLVGIGKISFSLYMWHQIVLAYFRYIYTDKFGKTDFLVISIIIITLSVFTYYFIEKPFRNKNKIRVQALFITTGITFILSITFSFYIYSISGILKDVPELDIVKSSVKTNLNVLDIKHNPHIKYNSRIYNLDNNFSNNNKVKILIIGDSFARDWANVLLESEYKNIIEIAYVESLKNSYNHKERFTKANYIFLSQITKEELSTITKELFIDTSKVWNIGTKSFGVNNGIFYNKKDELNYCVQRTNIESSYLEKNNLLKTQWGLKYIDLIGMVINEEGTLPVFTPECKFISQDGMHFTRSGAIYFAKLLSMYKGFKIE